MPNTAADFRRALRVAVGVVVDAQQRVLVAQRPDDAHLGGLWEFPGGKCEPGESAPQALGRELREELSIRVSSCSPCLQVYHDYGDRAVLLDVWRVGRYAGEPRGAEGQALRWVAIRDLDSLAFPAANREIIAYLRRHVSRTDPAASHCFAAR